MMKQKQTSRSRLIQLICLGLIVLANLLMPQSALADVSQEELNSILQTREIALEALNTGDFAQIKPYLHPEFTMTTVDNRVFHNADEFGKYWNQQLSGPLKSIAMELQGDTNRTFLSPETEVAYGDALATFNFTNGKAKSMAMRWTAVMQKLSDKWTIQSLHFSANFLDNPVLSAAKQLGRILAIAAGVGGFVLGTALMLLLRRQPKQATENASVS